MEGRWCSDSGNKNSPFCLTRETKNKTSAVAESAHSSRLPRLEGDEHRRLPPPVPQDARLLFPGARARNFRSPSTTAAKTNCCPLQSPAPSPSRVLRVTAGRSLRRERPFLPFPQRRRPPLALLPIPECRADSRSLQRVEKKKKPRSSPLTTRAVWT